MERVAVIAVDDLVEVMEEVAKELKPLLRRVVTGEEQIAINTFFCTLARMTLNIFDYLPPEQQDEMLTNCGTWFDIGVLLGNSPQLLLEILTRVKPQIAGVEIPDWLAARLRKG